MASEESMIPVDRVRASSFGLAADRYDQYRPACSDALADDLAQMGPKSALDVGCGTGQVARALMDRGVNVLGVEIDERLAEIARHHGVDVEVGAFETWEPKGRQFDLLTSGDAWGWLEPMAAMDRAAESIRPGGTLACFWTTRVLGEDVSAAFARVYSEHAPEVTQVWDPAVNIPRAHAARSTYFEQHPAFGSVELRTYNSEQVFSTQEWVGLSSTISDHIRLGERRLETLLDAVGAVIRRLGGAVPAEVETYALIVQRA